jgi:GntR family phosphonate transport system transcriptional regulator
MPTAEEARHLKQPKTRPVLVAEAVNVDQAGRPVEYGIACFASDWVQILVEP